MIILPNPVQYIYIYIYIYHYQVTLAARSSLDALSLSLSLSLSLTIHLYHPSLKAGFLVCIFCPHRVDVSLYWLTNTSTSMCKSPQKNIASCSCFSISAPHVLFVLLEWLVRWEARGRTPLVLWNVTSWICSRQRAVFLCSSLLAFSQCTLLASMWCIHIVLTAWKKSRFISSDKSGSSNQLWGADQLWKNYPREGAWYWEI